MTGEGRRWRGEGRGGEEGGKEKGGNDSPRLLRL